MCLNNMKVMLLTYCAFLIILGSVLEYQRQTKFIIFSLVFLTSLLKIWAFFYDFVMYGWDCYTYPNLFHFGYFDTTIFFVCLRLCCQTIFIIGLANWFPRKYINIVVALWFTNEMLATFANAYIFTLQYKYSGYKYSVKMSN